MTQEKKKKKDYTTPVIFDLGDATALTAGANSTNTENTGCDGTGLNYWKNSIPNAKDQQMSAGVGFDPNEFLRYIVHRQLAGMKEVIS